MFFDNLLRREPSRVNLNYQAIFIVVMTWAESHILTWLEQFSNQTFVNQNMLKPKSSYVILIYTRIYISLLLFLYNDPYITYMCISLYSPEYCQKLRK